MTYTVQFPGLGFSVNVNTDAFTLGSFTVENGTESSLPPHFCWLFCTPIKACKKLRI